MRIIEKKVVLAILFGLIFFIFGIKTLSDYGINWDETRRYYRGQDYVHFFLTGKKDYTDLKTNYKSIYQFPGSYTYLYFVQNNPIGHPPMSEILESLSNVIFFQNLHVLPDIESYHLFIVFAAAMTVSLVFYWTAENFGIFSGVIAYLSIFLYPLFLGESHFNFKDPVETFFFSFTLFTFFKGITKKSWKLLILSSTFAGFALSSKFNILFAVFIVIPWLFLLKWKDFRKFKWPFSLKISASLLFYPIIAFSIFILSWPYLWQDTFKNFVNVVNYYKLYGYGVGFQPSNYLIFGGINTFASQWILYATPISVIVLSLFGIFYIMRNGFKDKNKFSFLVLFWFLVPIVRVSLPKAGIIGGIREIMEFIPAMAIISGIGSYYIIQIFKRFNLNGRKQVFLQVFIILFFVPILLKIVSIHPNENVFYNSLIGGLKGGKEKNFQYWGNSFGNVYRQGANWLNTHAEKNAKVDLALNYEGSMPKIWLRPDINFSNQYRKNYLQKNGEYIVEITSDMPIWPPFCYWVYVRNFLEPVYEVKVEGVPILTIWKNDLQHTKKDFLSKDKLSLLNNCIEREEFN